MLSRRVSSNTPAFQHSCVLNKANGDFLAETVVQLQVAGKLGVRSLRGQTLAESSDYMQLGVHSVEAFGQSEALTTRLKHIISDYAAGPGILMELLQNADDAGASEVAFLLDEESYGTSSILGEGWHISLHQLCSQLMLPESLPLHMCIF